MPMAVAEQKPRKAPPQGLRLYVDLMSQPSRAILIFCRVNAIDAEVKLIKLSEGEHKSPEFKAINPLGQVPAISDSGFKLFESHAILRYLATTRAGADHWYPSDPSRRARIDSILDWHHGNLRRGTAGLVFSEVLAPVFGRPADLNAAKEGERVLKLSLNTIEDVWLRGNASYLGGSLLPSIADLSLCCELMQLELLGEERMSSYLEGKEKTKKWVSAVESFTAPHFAEVHRVVRKAAAKFRAERSLRSRM